MSGTHTRTHPIPPQPQSTIYMNMSEPALLELAPDCAPCPCGGLGRNGSRASSHSPASLHLCAIMHAMRCTPESAPSAVVTEQALCMSTFCLATRWRPRDYSWDRRGLKEVSLAGRCRASLPAPLRVALRDSMRRNEPDTHSAPAAPMVSSLFAPGDGRLGRCAAGAGFRESPLRAALPSIVVRGGSLLLLPHVSIRLSQLVAGGLRSFGSSSSVKSMRVTFSGDGRPDAPSSSSSLAVGAGAGAEASHESNIGQPFLSERAQGRASDEGR